MASARTLNDTAVAVAACVGCESVRNGTAGIRNTTACPALEAAGDALHRATSFVASVSAGPVDIERVTELVQTTTHWPSWAATMPLFALGCISFAVVAGAINGRRNL